MRASVDDLANEIRRVDESNKLGAGALAEALLPFLKDRFTFLPKLISARICFNLGWQAGYTSGWQGPRLGICAPQAFDESAVKDLMAAEPSWTPIEEHDGSAASGSPADRSLPGRRDVERCLSLLVGRARSSLRRPERGLEALAAPVPADALHARGDAAMKDYLCWNADNNTEEGGGWAIYCSSAEDAAMTYASTEYDNSAGECGQTFSISVRVDDETVKTFDIEVDWNPSFLAHERKAA